MIVMNPGGRESGSSSPQSAIDFVDEETDELLRQACQEGKFGKRKRAALKALACFCVRQSFRSSDNIFVQVFRRDGDVCPITGVKFIMRSTDDNDFFSNMAHIIPSSIQNKVDVNFSEL